MKTNHYRPLRRAALAGSFLLIVLLILLVIYLLALPAARGDGVVQQWVASHGSSGFGNDKASAVAVDSSGNVIVTGYSAGFGIGNDYYTAKYAAADGALLWETSYNGPANKDDQAFALAVDRSGNVIVTGSSNETGNFVSDYYTAKYAAADGALLWERRYNGPAQGNDAARAVALDGSGNVIVTGGSDGSGGKNASDFYTAKYAAADGALLWEQRYDGPAHGVDYATAVAVDGNGNVVVTGGSNNANLDTDCYTAKYAAADGALLWERRYNGPGNGNDDGSAVVVDGAGNVIITGASYGSGVHSDYYTAKYAAADGALLWERRYNGPANGEDIAAAVAVDSMGDVVVTGSSHGSGSGADFYTAKYAAADGSLLWERRYNGPANGTDAANTVVVDGSDNVLVTGYSSESGGSRGFYTAKYAAADGTLLWEQRYNGPVNGMDMAAGLAITPGGGVVVAGSTSLVGGNNYDFATVKYTPTDTTTLAATGVGMTSATFNGTVNPGGVETSVSYEWGTTPLLGNATGGQDIGAGAASVSVPVLLSGLPMGTTIYFRVRADSSQGTNYGAILSFTTYSAQTAGTLDGGYRGANIYRVDVRAIAVLPDGKAMVGGSFHHLNDLSRANVIKLNMDGSVDTSFTAITGDQVTTPPDVNSVAIQTDGQIILGGDFNTVNGVARNHYARLNPDGSLESTTTFEPGMGTNYHINGVTLQPDGKILLAGNFTSIDGSTSRTYLARLYPDGQLEDPATFAAPFLQQGPTYFAALQADGKILVGGDFTQYSGWFNNRLARLNTDGTVEGPKTYKLGNGADNSVYCAAIQADGKILIAGAFTYVGSQALNRIARLNPDGSVESIATFNPGTGANNSIYSMALQADGKILIGGDFTEINGTPCNRIARLNPDGSLESLATFNPGTGANGRVEGVALQADGKILLGGLFENINGGAGSYLLARLNNDAATQSLMAPDATRVQWLRGGAGPEVSQVTFELSTDGGSTWTLLGSGTRIAGGWQLVGLNLPAGGSIRARSRTSSGYHNGSTGLIETVVNFPSTPLEEWKFAHLDDNTAPDLGDPDGDGLPTLLEYGLALFPETPNTAPAVTLHDYAEGRRLRMFVSRDPTHNDVTVEVQAAGDLAGPWTTVAQSTLGKMFSGPGYVNGDSDTPGIKTVEVRDTVNLFDVARRFMRVRVTH